MVIDSRNCDISDPRECPDANEPLDGTRARARICAKLHGNQRENDNTKIAARRKRERERERECAALRAHFRRLHAITGKTDFLAEINGWRVGKWRVQRYGQTLLRAKLISLGPTHFCVKKNMKEYGLSNVFKNKSIR